MDRIGEAGWCEGTCVRGPSTGEGAGLPNCEIRGNCRKDAVHDQHCNAGGKASMLPLVKPQFLHCYSGEDSLWQDNNSQDGQ